MKFSLIITEDLKFSMWCNETNIPPSKVAHICKDKVIDSCSCVLNILAFIRNLSEERVLPTSIAIEECIKILTKVIPEKNGRNLNCMSQAS